MPCDRTFFFYYGRTDRVPARLTGHKPPYGHLICGPVRCVSCIGRDEALVQLSQKATRLTGWLAR